MRIFSTILCLLISNFLFADSYYVANAGSDANSGSIGTPFATIGKANSVAVSGDFVYLNRGDSWREMIIPISGVTYGAYGTGVRPLVTAFQTLSDFTNITGNIWQTTASNSVDSLNCVLINDTFAYKARYPNYNSTDGGFLTFTANYSGLPQLITSLPDSPNYAGDEVVYRLNPFVIDTRTITTQSGGYLGYTPNATGTGVGGGNGFFIQNDSSFVDTVNEYSYSKTTKKLVIYSDGEPTVKVSTIDTLVSITGHDIVFDNIDFEGGNRYTIKINSGSQRITIQNCNVNYSGIFGICGQKSSYVSLISDGINYSHSGGLYFQSLNESTLLADTCNNLSITYCTVKNTGLFAGMGWPGGTGYNRKNAISVMGSDMTILGNSIDSTGYIGIFFTGKDALIKYNLINHSLLTKDDGGGIYTIIQGTLPLNFSDGSVIMNNIVLNTMHNHFGETTSTYTTSVGIYIDNYSKNITVENNGINSTFSASILLHLSDSILVQNNVAYDSTGHCFWVSTTDDKTTVDGIKIFNNSFFENAPHPQYAVTITAGDNFGFFNYNHYYNPLTPNLFSLGLHTMASWQATGQDLNSTSTISNNTGNPVFIYNPTFSDSTIILDTVKKSLDGTIYYRKIVLKPFESKLVYPTDLVAPEQKKFSIGTLKFEQ